MSSGRTVIKFHANSPDLLSFNMDQPVKIFSKGAGRDRELWGVEVSHKWLYVLNMFNFDTTYKNILSFSDVLRGFKK